MYAIWSENTDKKEDQNAGWKKLSYKLCIALSDTMAPSENQTQLHQ